MYISIGCAMGFWELGGESWVNDGLCEQIGTFERIEGASFRSEFDGLCEYDSWR